MSEPNKNKSNVRIRVIQKLYSFSINPSEQIKYSNSRYKKFIKDVVKGTIERDELIKEIIEKNLADDLNFKRTDKILKIIVFAAIYELLFKHNNPTKVIISEYVKASEFFLEESQIKFLNAILDKISKKIR